MSRRLLPTQVQRPKPKHRAMRADSGLSAAAAAGDDHCADTRSPGCPDRAAFVTACRVAAIRDTFRSIRSNNASTFAFRRAAASSGRLPALRGGKC